MELKWYSSTRSTDDVGEGIWEPLLNAKERSLTLILTSSMFFSFSEATRLEEEFFGEETIV
mgnify:CR=1 FL=1